MSRLGETRTNLHWLDGNYTTIQSHLAPGGPKGAGNRAKPSSRPPLNTAALSLVQRGGITGVLREWAELVVESRHINPVPHRLAAEPYFHNTVTLLLNHLDWADAQPWFGDMHAEIWQLRRSVEWVCGLNHEAPIPGDHKHCVLDNDAGEPCGGALYQDFELDVIYCRARPKTHVWGKPQWLMLGRMLRADELEETA